MLEKGQRHPGSWRKCWEMIRARMRLILKEHRVLLARERKYSAEGCYVVSPFTWIWGLLKCVVGWKIRERGVPSEAKPEGKHCPCRSKMVNFLRSSATFHCGLLISATQEGRILLSFSVLYQLTE